MSSGADSEPPAPLADSPGPATLPVTLPYPVAPAFRGILPGCKRTTQSGLQLKCTHTCARSSVITDLPERNFSLAMWPVSHSSASRCRASCDTWGAPGKQTMTMLMLSKLPCRGRQKDERRQRSMTWVQISLRSSHTCRRLRTKAHSSSLPMASHTPSHARIRNSSSSVLSISYTSGSGDTSCSVCGLQSTSLKSKSPRALDTASEPLTLWRMTEPPAFWMRSFSRGLTGLWSSV
ncbi:hypothetical protein EYF80_034947 [Liparis tanakae]|uniref:Uncharacterized protein n=1 Tax=Liparis tanakae TaxID=230148 RepID=A0A4Z2GMH6_9TELE|nr:hypothetical protein EYF80_034947 [Liparis tanakae]